MVQCSTTSFDGQDVFCGFDVHKDSWEVCPRVRGVQTQTFHAAPDVEGIVATLRRRFPGARFHSVYEAGFSGFEAHRRLAAAGFDNIVVNPADVPTSDKERVCKCDRTDCRKLARALENGDLHGIHIPSREQERMRSLVRRESQVRDATTRTANQLKGAIHFHGLRAAPKHLGAAVLRGLEAEAEREGDYETLSLVRQLRFLREERARVIADERRLQEKLGFSRDVGLLRSVPGVGPRTATVVQAELGDVSRFPTRDRLASYVGLSPHLHGSGANEKAVASGNRKQKQLHYLLVEAAWHAVRIDPALCACYASLCRRHAKTRAIIGTARKLLFIIQAVLLRGQPYSQEAFLARHPGLEQEARKGGTPEARRGDAIRAEAAMRAETSSQEDAIAYGDEDDSLAEAVPHP